MRTVTVPRLALVASVATALVGLGAGAAVAGGAKGAPAGNNGTVKIDRVAFDDHPGNEPHVGCTFQVDFYGFDKGDLYAEVRFTAQPPTQRASGSQVLLEDTVFIGEDDNGGGGSEAGLDASRTYTLDLSGITPHPQQGVHVKLTVEADGSQGADTKHKVFWVSGCREPEPEGEEETPTPTPTPSTSTSTPTKSPRPTPVRTPTTSPAPTTSTSTTPVTTPTPSPSTSTPPAEPCEEGSDDPDCDVVETPPAFTG